MIVYLERMFFTTDYQKDIVTILMLTIWRNSMSIKSLELYAKTIHLLSKLTDFDEAQLLEPIQVDKWSVREIVGHLYYWDKFILEQQAPNMANGAILPPFPDHDNHNQEATKYIQRFESMDTLIDKFTETRKHLIDILSSKKDNINFTIGTGKRQFTVVSFLNIFIKHDAHHMKQINAYMELGH